MSPIAKALVAAACAAIGLWLWFTRWRHPEDPPAVASVAGIISSMQQDLRRHADLRGVPLDRLTEDQRDVLRNTLHDLAVGCAGLRTHMPLLGAHNSHRMNQLEVFLGRWSSDQDMEDGLLAAPGARNALDADLNRLARIFPESQWRTLFPLFRP